MLEALKSLSDLTPSAMESALTNLALRGTDTSSYGSLGDTEQRLAAELWEAVGAMEQRESEAKFYDLLNTAFDEVSGLNNQERIKNTAGLRGDLWPSLYRVLLPPYAEHHCRQIRLLPRLAIDAVQHPEAVDHLNPEGFGYPDDTPYSISLKFRGTSLKRYGIVALSERKGDELIIRRVWTFFVHDIDLENARRPVDVLQVFANHYGGDIVVAGEKAKFFLYRAIPFLEAGEPPEKSISVLGAHGKRYIGDMIFKIDTVAKKLKVGIAYQIDIQKYTTDLLKHGIKPKFKFPTP
jgi:hypothetical protein